MSRFNNFVFLFVPLVRLVPESDEGLILSSMLEVFFSGGSYGPLLNSVLFVNSNSFYVFMSVGVKFVIEEVGALFGNRSKFFPFFCGPL